MTQKIKRVADPDQGRAIPKADTNIYPTFHCFDDALDLMVDMLKAHEHDDPDLADRLRLVHGACVWPEDGKLYAHAWLEDVQRGVAYFTGIFQGERMHFEAATADYHEHLEVQDLIRYSYAEAFQLNRKTEHYGPWVEHLRQLCRKKGEPLRAATSQREG